MSAVSTQLLNIQQNLPNNSPSLTLAADMKHATSGNLLRGFTIGCNSDEPKNQTLTPAVTMRDKPSGGHSFQMRLSHEESQRREEQCWQKGLSRVQLVAAKAKVGRRRVLLENSVCTITSATCCC